MKVKYSEDVDILLLELSKKPIDYAQEAGNYFALQFKERVSSDRIDACQQHL